MRLWEWLASILIPLSLKEAPRPPILGESDQPKSPVIEGFRGPSRNAVLGVGAFVGGL